MTSWRIAYFRQAQSDNDIRKLLNSRGAAYCHQLHYLQMFSEKLAKGWLTSETATHTHRRDGRLTHDMLLPVLRAIHNQSPSNIWKPLGYVDRKQFQAAIQSLLPVAVRVQNLAPSNAGTSQPNPEYPWGPEPSNGHDVTAPCDHAFSNFNPTDIHLIRLIRFLENLLSLESI